MKKSRLLGALCTIYFVVLTSAANAAFINGSFEDGSMKPLINTIDALFLNDTRIEGWTVTANSVDWVGNGYWQASEGLWSIDVNGEAVGEISQTFDTIIGQQYQVLFDMAGNPEGAPVIKTLQVSAASAVSTYAFDITGKTHTNMGWAEKEFLFTATDNLTTLAFTSLSITSGNRGPALDNVRVNAVPIPPALWLFGSGLLGLVGMARRKRHLRRPEHTTGGNSLRQSTIWTQMI